MKIKEMIKDVYAATVGNRVMAIGTALMATGFGGMLTVYDETNLMFWGAAGIFLAGAPFVGISQFGIKTAQFYNWTKESIKECGHLDERFVKAVLGSEKIKPFIGYCQIQGVYLAAREKGQLEAFRQVRRTIENKIPNF
jgi:hypothetical protein